MRRGRGKDIHYVLLPDSASLVWSANLEIHALGGWGKAKGGNGRDSMVDWFVIQVKTGKFMVA